MQQRYYDSVIGRFYSNDPVGFSASNPMMFNRYAYANNNPYKYTDPDGRYLFPTTSGSSGRLAVDMRPMNPGRSGPDTPKFTDVSNNVSSAATIGLVGCALVCQPALPALGYLAAGSGLASAATSDSPGKDIAVEVGTMGAGRKVDALADLAKGAKELTGKSAGAVDASATMVNEVIEEGAVTLVDNAEKEKNIK